MERNSVGPLPHQFRSNMPAVTLKADYDGERIILDEPFEILHDSLLVVNVLPVSEALGGEDRILAAQKALSGAYGTDEPEYGMEDLRR